MHVPKSNVFILFFLTIILGLLTVSCSDNKSTGPAPQWRWATFGTEDFVGGTLALTVYDGKLIAAGSRVGAWDGSSWATLISNVSGVIGALAVYDNKLIAAGNFTSLYTETGQEINANYIASWDGTAWSSLGTGMDADIWGLTVWNNKLIACGNFDNAGGTGALRIAAWDGFSWDSFGAGWNETSLNSSTITASFLRELAQGSSYGMVSHGTSFRIAPIFISQAVHPLLLSMVTG